MQKVLHGVDGLGLFAGQSLEFLPALPFDAASFGAGRTQKCADFAQCVATSVHQARSEFHDHAFARAQALHGSVEIGGGGMARDHVRGVRFWENLTRVPFFEGHLPGSPCSEQVYLFLILTSSDLDCPVGEPMTFVLSLLPLQ